MKKYFPFVALICLLASSCGLHIQKRLYRDGFYICYGENKTYTRQQNCDEQNSANAICNEMAQKGADTVPPVVPKTYSEYQSAEFLQTPTEQMVDTLQLVPATEDRNAAPVPESEIAKIEKLNEHGTACLKASILVFPLAFLMLSIALTLSLISLSKIRKLTRRGNISAGDEKKLAEHKKRARKTAWISAIILTLIIIGFIIFFSVSGTFVNGGNILIGL